MYQLKLHNTLTKNKSDFIPLDKKHVRMYTCGPTVYNYAHIGNARPAVISDLLVRLLRYLYPKVTYVSNITDIDDKIIKKSKETKTPIAIITEKFEKIYNEDMDSLGVLPPDIQPRATEHIEDMIVLINKMIKNGYAYESEKHVLFDVTSYNAYGKLSGRDIEDQLAGSRVEVASYKKDPGDFVLWKPSYEDDPGWESPWGFGRPGWHLECSAMSEKNLGLPFDIHGGGMDLIFPHHENEIAQSCGAHNEQNNPQIFVKYWIHNAMLNIGGKKMSKSLGNIFYIKDYLKKYPGEVLRLALLSGHYRQSLNWTDESIEQAHSMLNRLYRILKKVEHIESKDGCIAESVMKCLCDDLNTPEALAAINKIANKLSKETDLSKLSNLKSELLWSVNMLGILQESPDKWLGIGQVNELTDSNEIEILIDQRKAARDSKDFSKADEIRDKLNNMGIEIEDTEDGTIWRTK
jgi:cysteinyl-tRNA synthetase